MTIPVIDAGWTGTGPELEIIRSDVSKAGENLDVVGQVDPGYQLGPRAQTRINAVLVSGNSSSTVFDIQWKRDARTVTSMRGPAVNHPLPYPAMYRAALMEFYPFATYLHNGVEDDFGVLDYAKLGAAVGFTIVSLPEGQVIFYPLDQAEGNGLADLEGGPDLVLTGTLTFRTDQAGVANAAVVGDGNSAGAGGYLRILSSALNPFALHTAGSISFWLITNATQLAGTTRGMVVNIDFAGQTVGYRIEKNNVAQQYRGRMDDTVGTKGAVSTGHVVADTWTHMCMTWTDGGFIRFYVGGVERAAVARAASLTGAFQTSSIMAVTNGGVALDVDGLSNVRIFDRELTATDVETLRDGLL